MLLVVAAVVAVAVDVAVVVVVGGGGAVVAVVVVVVVATSQSGSARSIDIDKKCVVSNRHSLPKCCQFQKQALFGDCRPWPNCCYQ